MFVTFLVRFQQVNAVLFEVIFLLKLVSLESKSVFVTKFACANLALKFSVVTLLNPEVAIMYSS